MKALCTRLRQLPTKDLGVGVRHLPLEDICGGARHFPLEDLCVGVRQLPVNGCYSLEPSNSQRLNLVGIRQIQLEEWMNGSSWN